MKAYLINMLVPRSRSSEKVKVKYKGYISQKMAISGPFVFHKHILFELSLMRVRHFCMLQKIQIFSLLPKEKILDVTLKAFADDKLSVAKMTISLYDKHW